MKTVKENAYAKINFCLNITGKSGEYHALDTAVAEISLRDTLLLRTRNDDKVDVAMPTVGLEVPSNNAYLAATLFRDSFRTNGADIKITKRIPMSGGLGGSSADISATLRGMERLYETQGDLKQLADSLGSDSGYMLTGGFARLKGRGEIVEQLSVKEKYYFTLIALEKGVSAADCFALFDAQHHIGIGADVAECLKGLAERDYSLIKKNCFNALFAPACSIVPEIGRAYSDMESLSPEFTFMSGSGSTILGCFDTPELCFWAKEKLSKKYDDVIVTETV